MGPPGWQDLLWEKVGKYMVLSERFGWTVDQIDDQPEWYISRVIPALNILDAIRDEKAEAQRKASG